MAILNMVREGLFGELLHCQGGYQHDLQERVVMGKGTGVVLPEGGDYRTRQNRMRNASLYPTHGVGPIANLLNIDRGNRFSFLVSVASKSRGLSDWIRENLEPGHRFADIDWAHGDVVTTVIKCVNGETIVLDHDVQLPRARTHNKRVQGTRGIWMGDMNSIYLEGRSAGHKWESFDRYLTEFDHPLWRRYEQEGVSDTGHGGIDFLVIRAFKETVKRRTSPPLDVYDTASWMAISPLSEQSIVLGSQPVAFPDFTNGKWMYKHQPIFGFGAEY
jgi:hypothetical protein